MFLNSFLVFNRFLVSDCVLNKVHGYTFKHKYLFLILQNCYQNYVKYILIFLISFYKEQKKRNFILQV